jgi:hypothetical protein
MEKPVNGCQQRSMLNVLKKLFMHVLSNLKQNHTALPYNKNVMFTRAVLGQ